MVVLKYVLLNFSPIWGRTKPILTFHIFSGWVGEKLQPGPSKNLRKKKTHQPRFSWIFGRFERTLAAATNFPRSAETTCHHGELCTVERGQLSLGGWWPTPLSKVDKTRKTRNVKKGHDEQTAYLKKGVPQLQLVRFLSKVMCQPETLGSSLFRTGKFGAPATPNLYAASDWKGIYVPLFSFRQHVFFIFSFAQTFGFQTRLAKPQKESRKQKA